MDRVHAGSTISAQGMRRNAGRGGNHVRRSDARLCQSLGANSAVEAGSRCQYQHAAVEAVRRGGGCRLHEDC
jgi:hypothetical protein